MPRAKNWCFTLNNYDENDIAKLSNLVRNNHAMYVIFGKEQAPTTGTHHLQGFVAFSKQLRMSAVKEITSRRMCLNVAKGSPLQNKEYCSKDGDFKEFGILPSPQGKRTDLEDFKKCVREGNYSRSYLLENHSMVMSKHRLFCREYIQLHLQTPVFEDHPLRPWQQKVYDFLEETPDDRTILFVVDTVGNAGKTWFAHWYASRHENTQVLLPGKKADMTYCLDPSKTVFFVDCPRSKSDTLQYDFLEEVKNGFVFSPKYESDNKVFKRPHLVVLLNEYPDDAKMSADRPIIIDTSINN